VGEVVIEASSSCPRVSELIVEKGGQDLKLEGQPVPTEHSAPPSPIHQN